MSFPYLTPCVRSIDFRSGVEAHLRTVLKNLKMEESTLNKKAGEAIFLHWTNRVYSKKLQPLTQKQHFRALVWQLIDAFVPISLSCSTFKVWYRKRCCGLRKHIKKTSLFIVVFDLIVMDGHHTPIKTSSLLTVLSSANCGMLIWIKECW